MAYKPSDLFIGVSDFFAILLPGALLAAVLVEPMSPLVFGPLLPKLDGEAERWVAFAAASYMLGHFAHMIGSYLDFSYNAYRKRRMPPHKDRLYKAANDLRVKMLAPLGETNDREKEIVNAYKWSKAFVLLRSGAASAEILRLEADSKFFRSLVVVLIAIALIQVYSHERFTAGVCVILAIMAFLRYADQRFKSTDLAYTYLIALRDVPVRASEAAADKSERDDE